MEQTVGINVGPLVAKVKFMWSLAVPRKATATITTKTMTTVMVIPSASRQMLFMMTLTYVHIARSHAVRRHAISRTYSCALSSCLRCSSSTPPLSHFGNHRHPITSSVYSGLSLCIGIHAHCVLPWTVQTVGAHRACYDATVLIFCSSLRAREYDRVHFRRCASIFSVLL